MRVSIIVKLLFLMMILTIVPLGILGLMSIKYVANMESSSLKSVDEINKTVVSNSTEALNNLGAVVIKNQALATKQMVEMYLDAHPNATIDSLINDPVFQKIGIQPVGEKGYTTVIVTKPQILLTHPNTDMMGKPLLEGMKSNPKMQDWWKVVKVTWDNNVDNSGYYQWPEKDGSYSEKYMYLAVIDRKIEGQGLSVSATTYIEEFNAPVKETEAVLNEKIKSIAGKIMATRKDIQSSTYKFLVLMIIITSVIAIFFAKTISDPIKKLKVAADKVTSGDLDAKLPRSKSKDEVAELIASMEMLITAFKSKNKT